MVTLGSGSGKLEKKETSWDSLHKGSIYCCGKRTLWDSGIPGSHDQFSFIWNKILVSSIIIIILILFIIYRKKTTNKQRNKKTQQNKQMNKKTPQQKKKITQKNR